MSESGEGSSSSRSCIRSKRAVDEPARLSPERSGSSLRLEPPLSQTGERSIGKLPTVSSAKKDNTPITDKNLQDEQLLKVKRFIAHYDPSIDHNLIKAGMPIDMFIQLTAAFFKIIDDSILITRENYVEEVPSRLRLFKYPRNVEPSLMEAVNVPHSWPSVISILAWLTDVVIELNRDEELGTLPDIVLKCFTDRYNLWNKGEEDTNELERPIRELETRSGEYFLNDIEKRRQLERQNLISTCAYKYNNLISEMEILDPSFKELHIRESEFFRSDTEQGLNIIQQKITALESEMKEDLNVKQSMLRDANQENKKVEDKLTSVSRELQELIKSQAELELELEHKNSKFASEKQLTIDKLVVLRCKLSELISKRPNVEMLEQKALEIEDECNRVDEETRQLKYETFNLVTELDSQISNNLLNYMEIMDNSKEGQ